MKQNFSLSTVAVHVFRKWSNRPYAVFSSLKLQIRIAVLALAYSLVVKPEMAVAQQDSTEQLREINLQEVVVGALRTPTTHAETARIVHVIDRAELRAAAIQSIDDLLRYLPNVDLRQRGKYGVQADVSLRGGSFDQVLILLNGINLSDPQTGHHNLNLPVDLDDVERIEILEGPASKVLGPNAFSGAINFITGQRKGREVGAHLLYGQNNLSRLNANLRLPTGPAQHYLSATRKGSNGYRDNTDFYSLNGYYHGSLQLPEAQVDWQLGANDKSFGSNGFYTPVYPKQWEATRTYFGSVRLQTGTRLRFTPAVYWRRNYDHFLLNRDNPAMYENFHATEVLGTNLNTHFRSLLGRTSLGVDVRSESILSNRLGNTLARQIEVPGQKDKFYTRHYARQSISYFAEHSVSVGNFWASAGVMGNVHSDLVNDFNLLPGIEMAYYLVPSLKVYAAYNTAMRMPTFTDLFYVGPTNIGNPLLKPERSATIEGGLKYLAAGMSANLTVFHRQGTDMIDWVRASTTDKWQSQNLTELNTLGVSVAAQLHPRKFWGEGFPVRNLQVSYSFLDQNKASGLLLSNYVLDYLRHKLNLNLDLQLYRQLHLNLQNSYQQRQGSYTAYGTDGWGKETAYSPFWLSDMRLSWQAEQYTAYIEVSNIADTEYNDLGNLPQPGRWVMAGLRMQLGF